MCQDVDKLAEIVFLQPNISETVTGIGLQRISGVGGCLLL